jgi:WD40 repeat protein
MGLKQIKCAKTLNHTHPISCVAFHPNQVDFMIGDEAGNLLRWDIRTNQAQLLVTS